MSTLRRLLASFVLFALVPTFVLSACQAMPASNPSQPTMVAMGTPVVVTAVVTRAAQPTRAAATPTSGLPPSGSGNLPDVPPAQPRMIIKNGDVGLLVLDTDTAVDGVTQVAIDTGGYILSSRTWIDGGFKFASLTIGVPSDQYEGALARLRRLALMVTRETSSGQDVTEEYVDLDSRLRNLQTQADRLRAFMAEAKNVQEAITVTQALSDVEDQIETIKGRMTYLQGRSAYSTITVDVEPQRPTPTPTPTPTATPLPTAWSPAPTFERASQTTVFMFQGLIESLIWLLVVVAPFLVPVGAFGYWLWRRNNRARKG
jgi:hypothetical protein